MDQLMWVACLAAARAQIELHLRDEIDRRQSVAVGDTERDDLLSARARGRLDELEHTRTR